MNAAPLATRPGRPLDQDLSDTILDAAVRVLTRDGYGGFNMAAVATEAGVHRPAIYRRWDSKADLAVAAIGRLRPPPVDPQSGDVRDDLVDYLVHACCSSGDTQTLLIRLQSELATHDDLAVAVERQLTRPRRRLLARIIERGIAAGQLRADLDVDLAIDLLSGVLHSRKLRKPSLRPADVQRFVDLALDGLR